MNPYKYWTIAFRRNGGKWEFPDRSRSGIQADPFLAIESGHHYLFYEKADPVTFKGKLVCMDLDASRRKARTILKEPFHLSYPNVFKVRNQWYMIPESKQNHKITLYQATEFPWKWEKVRDLLEGNAVDTTFLYKDNKWIFFTYMDNALHIFTAEADQDGLPEKLKEVKSQKASKRSRPGGNFVTEKEKLYRPAQIGEHFYGEGLVYCRQKWNIPYDLYEEEETEELRAEQMKTPGHDVIGIHTYNRLQDMEVVDLYCEQRGIIAVIKKLVFITMQVVYEKVKGKA